MSFLNKVKDLAGKNPDKVDQLVEKAGDAFDAKTGGKYARHTDTAQTKAGEYLRGDQARPADPATGAPAPGEQPPA